MSTIATVFTVTFALTGLSSLLAAVVAKILGRSRAAGSSYESVQAIVQQEDKYAALLAQCKKDLQAFLQKYNQIKELAPIAEAAKPVISA